MPEFILRTLLALLLAKSAAGLASADFCSSSITMSVSSSYYQTDPSFRAVLTSTGACTLMVSNPESWEIMYRFSSFMLASPLDSIQIWSGTNITFNLTGPYTWIPAGVISHGPSQRVIVQSQSEANVVFTASNEISAFIQSYLPKPTSPCWINCGYGCSSCSSTKCAAFSIGCTSYAAAACMLDSFPTCRPGCSPCASSEKCIVSGEQCTPCSASSSVLSCPGACSKCYSYDHGPICIGSVSNRDPDYPYFCRDCEYYNSTTCLASSSVDIPCQLCGDGSL